MPTNILFKYWSDSPKLAPKLFTSLMLRKEKGKKTILCSKNCEAVKLNLKLSGSCKQL